MLRHLTITLAFYFFVVVFLPTTANAQVTKTFCITGTSDGKPWTWELSGTGLPSQSVTAPAVPNGGNATALAQNWVASIQAVQGRPPAFTATFLRTEEDGRACFTITAAREFTFRVDSCTITNNPAGCSFNPRVVEVGPSGSPTTAQGQSPIRWIAIVLGLVLLVAILIFLVRRRRP